VLHSYKEWGMIGESIFGLHLFSGPPWIEWFAPLSKWLAVILTLVSGCIYLWRNRTIYLEDM
jgi:hypothetical protein